MICCPDIAAGPFSSCSAELKDGKSHILQTICISDLRCQDLCAFPGSTHYLAPRPAVQGGVGRTLAGPDSVEKGVNSVALRWFYGASFLLSQILSGRFQVGDISFG